MLRRILYISTVLSGMTRPELDRVVARSRMNNRRLDVTGVLALGRGVFAQVLEGGAEAVETTLERIRRDARHTDIRLLMDESAALRCFDRWSMELLTDDQSARLAEDVRDGRAAPDELLVRLREKHAEDPHC